MPAKTRRIPIPGSEKAPVAGARVAGDVPDDERFEVTLRLRPRQPLNQAATLADADVLPKQRTYLSREAYAEQHGADPADIAKVVAFAQDHGLVVVETSPERRSVVLSGTAAAFSQAFGVKLQQFEHDQGTFRGRTGGLTVPENLDGIIEGVFGLDNRPAAKPHIKIKSSVSTTTPTPNVGMAMPMPSVGMADPRGGAGQSLSVPQVGQLYHFPAGLDGSNQCIGIIELDGGYRTADIKAYFKGIGLPAPKVKMVSVDGGKNHPTTYNSADGEVMLDIEVAAAIAPKAKIVVYFAPNTDQGFLDAITYAIHDTRNKPSIISISWGNPESNWTSQSMTQFNQAFQTAATLGVTVCAAAGDSGSTDGVTDGGQHVDFPASSPFVLGCGGTELTGTGSTITGETVWNELANNEGATGGGVSNFFDRPVYQQNINVTLPGGQVVTDCRGVPDVAGDADPVTGYQVRVDGQNFIIGGTSAVAPLWAGLLALINQKLGTPVGFLNPLIYGSLAGLGLFNDIVSGNNEGFSAGSGWDACTGWGSPIGDKLLAALGG